MQYGVARLGIGQLNKVELEGVDIRWWREEVERYAGRRRIAE